ncbi:ubiquitin-conjugating enzyme/RWD-like protein [Tanacetum coccineum]
MEINNEDQDEVEAVRMRRYINRERDVAEERLMADYFGPQPKYPAEYFRRRYRMNRELFLEIVQGANNDITVLHHSPLFDDLLVDNEPMAPYVVNGQPFDRGYYLADGIYPQWTMAYYCSTGACLDCEQATKNHLVHYRSGGLGINPNMYKCGKVLLSLRKTSRGEERMWVLGSSTMLQLLVSIQDRILNAKPLFNDMTYSVSSGSVYGEESSVLYNRNTFIKTLKTMVYTMQSLPKNFEVFVVGYFRNLFGDILAVCDKEAKDTGSDRSPRRFNEAILIFFLWARSKGPSFSDSSDLDDIAEYEMIMEINNEDQDEVEVVPMRTYINRERDVAEERLMADIRRSILEDDIA